MKLRTALFSALILATGFSALPAQAEKMYNIRGKLVSESFYKQLIIHCPTRKTFFKEYNYECKSVLQYVKKRRKPPVTYVEVKEADLLKTLQNRDGVLRESSGGSDNPRQFDPNRANDNGKLF